MALLFLSLYMFIWLWECKQCPFPKHHNRDGKSVLSRKAIQDVDETRRLTRALSRTNRSKLLLADESVMNELLPAEGRKIFTEDLSNFSPGQFQSTVELVKTRENVRKIMDVLQDAAPEILIWLWWVRETPTWQMD